MMLIKIDIKLSGLSISFITYVETLSNTYFKSLILRYLAAD